MNATYEEISSELLMYKWRYQQLTRAHDELRARYSKLLSEHITELELSSRKTLELALRGGK